MDLKAKREELVTALQQAREQYVLAGVNVQRIEGAVALLDHMLTEEAEGENEDVPASD